MSRLFAARALVFGLVATSTVGASLVACSSSDDNRQSFVSDDAATPEASLPDSAEPGEASAPDVDASLAPLVDEPVVCETTPCATQIAAGLNHICARMSDGTAKCWGRNHLGQLGHVDSPSGGPEADAGMADKIPPVADLTGVKQLSAADNTACALLDDGTVNCWGANNAAQLGIHPENPAPDSSAHTAAPVALPGPASYVELAISGACAMLEAGGVACWGSNSTSNHGLLARSGFANNYGAPGIADLLEPFSPVHVGGNATSRFALTKDGTLVGWGHVSARLSSLVNSPVPSPIPSLRQISEYSFGPSHFCVIAGGEIYCWGFDDYFAPYLGTGLPDSVSIMPVHAPIEDTHVSARPQRVASGYSTTCTRLTDGTIQCCGDNSRGQIGNGKLGADQYLLTPANAFTDYAVQIVASERTTCALTRGGKVQCWGANGYGELGQGTADNDPHPTPVTVQF